MYDWQTENKDDMEAIQKELEGRHKIIYDVDISEMVNTAIKDMEQRASSKHV